MNILFIILEEPSTTNPFMHMLPILLIVIVIYFFMIRPQHKKAKKEKQFRESLAKGDRVVTIGGIHGKILQVKEKTVILDIGDGNKLKVEKTAISMDNSIKIAKNET